MTEALCRLQRSSAISNSGPPEKGEDSLLKAEFIEDNLKSEADRRECDLSVPSNSSMSFAWNICHPSQLVIPFYTGQSCSGDPS